MFFKEFKILTHYTLSHPENDRDVTECVQGFTLQLQDAFFMRHSRRSFLSASEDIQVPRAMTSVFIWYTR